MSAVTDYRGRGWHPIPLRPRDKLPATKNFDKVEYRDSDFRRGRNVGVILGSWSNGLVDVDLDCEEAVELADIYLPRTGSMFGRASKPKSHRLYYSPGSVYEKFSDPAQDKKPVMIELRTDTAAGCCKYTAFPESVHSSGEAYRWDEDGEPRVIEPDRLRTACVWLAIGCMVMRHCHPWIDSEPAKAPWMGMAQNAMNSWPGLIEPFSKWLGIENPHRVLRPPKRFDDDTDVPAIVASITNDLDRDQWIKAGMAIYACMGDAGWPVFLEFSRRSPRHHNVKTVEANWKSFQRHPPRSVGIGTLHYLAQGGR